MTSVTSRRRTCVFANATLANTNGDVCGVFGKLNDWFRVDRRRRLMWSWVKELFR
ncbi:MAG: hypothetical protein ACYC06_11585 [Ilumatobacteraceae bacterium]